MFENLDHIKDKRITIIGGGVSGTALALWAAHIGANVFVSELKASLPEEITDSFAANGILWETGGHTSQAFEADYFVVGSGISPHAGCVEEALKRGIPVIGEMDFIAPHLHGEIIGITGSNGKSTVTAAIGYILNKKGFKTAVGGNLGEAVALFADKYLDYIVLELSSFQLYWANRLKNKISIITNLAPDHIDWHGSYEAYIAAKAKILTLRSTEGWGIVQDCDVEALNAHNLPNLVVLGWDNSPLHPTAGHIYMGEKAAFLRLADKETQLFEYKDVSLLGKHNLENVAMSLASMHFLDISAKLPEAMDGFRPLPHRCELAGKVKGVLYIDDSKGTNVAASVTAMSAIDGRKIVILGGQGKGEDYSLLAETVKKEADAAIVLGAEQERIAEALKNTNYDAIHAVRDMQEAVLLAYKLARPGMVVLLSPACTSWDMYSDYKKRGEHFCSLVHSLEG